MNRQQRRARSQCFQKLERARAAQTKAFVRKAQVEGWGEWKHKDPNSDHADLVREATGNDVCPNYFWYNNVCSVQGFEHNTTWGVVTQLLIRDHENHEFCWKDKQRIKDELCGSDRIAVEVFPEQENLVDQADVYHLWVLPQGFELPFGLHFSDWSQAGRYAIARREVSRIDT